MNSLNLSYGFLQGIVVTTALYKRSIPGEAEVPWVVSRVRSTNLDGKMAAGNQANRKINTISSP